jgi:hypothetical protein
MRGLLKRHALRSKISHALDARVGFYEATFPLDVALDQLNAWCRETLAQTDRPYGVDYVTLAIALEAPAGSRDKSATFRVLRPGDFYEGGAAMPQIESTIAAWLDSGAAPPRGSKLHAILFSWGDLTRNLLKAS